MDAAAPVATWKLWSQSDAPGQCQRGALIYFTACFPLFVTIKQLAGLLSEEID